ncbi:unnamed protein product [Chilo suppressalis]|uniref:Uncharacterized protein n=1 Tax=Chilo suppressalis TaxID=168631 RepID=A0ABN8B2J8_CHISP|nr:unnamed protein product [Chilo suppressalis]
MGIFGYIQEWRMAKPIMAQSAAIDTWNDDIQEVSPVRRRLGRKRKRRPPADPIVEVDPQNKYTYIDGEPPAHQQYDLPSEDEAEMPRRRRKKVRPNRWTDEPIDENVPIRRRLQRRRKRPSLDNRPTLSEFGGFSRDTENNKDSELVPDYKEEGIGIDNIKYKTFDVDDEYMEREIKVPESKPKRKFTLLEDNEESDITLKEDKSLSEFSMEVLNSNEKNKDDSQGVNNVNLHDKVREKSPTIFYNMDSSQEKVLVLELDKYFDFKSEYISMKRNRKKKKAYNSLRELIHKLKSVDKNDYLDLRKVPKQNQRKISYKMPMKTKEKDLESINPQTLKDILKRSNGTSLSEILQQHNLTLADLLSGNKRAVTVLQSQNLLQTTKNVTVSISDVSDPDKLFKSKNNNKSTVSASGKNIKPKVENKENQFDSEHSENKDQDSGAAIPKTDSLPPESDNHLKTKSTNRARVPALRKITKPRVENNENRLNSENSENKNVNSFITLSQNDSLLTETKRNDINEEKDSNKNVNNGTKSNNIISSSVRNDLLNGSTSTDSAIVAKRRFTGGIRRKLRMRPMLSNNYKSQLNRDLVALSARRYIHHNRRNTTKAMLWKDMLPLMPNFNVTTDSNVSYDDITLAPKFAPEETTTFYDIEDLAPSTIADTTHDDNDIHDQTVTTNTDEVETTTLVLEILESEMPSSITEKPIIKPIIRTESASGLRRQVYNNRLKKKRLKHKTSTTEAPPDEVMKNFLNMGDYVSSSEFIARTQKPKLTSPIDMRETATELEDFMTTVTTSQINTGLTSKKPNLYKFALPSTTFTEYPITTTTEETAKIEIEEILNDTSSSARLSRILKERNMTLGELLEHRERGSSYVHLADIFHNASREPNPPEPFLTKSSLEPISKETYPLRALLDANLHDTTTKSSTTDAVISLANHITIPMTMAFGNNVNENAENMGIMSLFNNFTIDDEQIQETSIQKDSEGTPYRTTIIHVNATDDEPDTRDSRMMSDDQDMVSWNEIFAMIRKQRNNESSELEKSGEGAQLLTTQKTVEETNGGGDRFIAIEHLQHLSETDSNVQSGSMEKVEFNSYESGEYLHNQNVPNNLPSSAKSVTVATASLVGIAMVLFLLTYTVLKWRQQKSLNRKNNFHNERIPTPVFENRKIKKNCSSRSISPMLSTSNIYTMNTLESQNGKDSPEYMWDTLRKPFQ